MFALRRTITNSSLLRTRIIPSCRRFLATEYPEHEVIGLPALSPTMEFGGIANWVKKEGESISAGDILVEIETDKATVDFEAQDDAFLAKILVDSGTTDLPVGTPIAVLVEEESDVAAFGNYVAPAEPAAPEPAAPVATKEAAPALTPPSPTPPPPTPPPPTPLPSSPPPAGTVNTNISFDRYGVGVKDSALSSYILESQREYTEMYGSTLLEVNQGVEE
jgi:pyruvate dehydrogenase E2 component (dihydrolipoamide acetyltransferase)